MLTPVETGLIALLLVVLMFGMGATLTLAHFRRVLKGSRAFLIGTASQFGFMPLLSYLLAKGLGLPNEAALGLVAMYTAAFSLGASGMLFGALVSRAFGLSTAARRTVSFETGVQNSPLCFAILLLAFPSADQVSILKLPLLYSLFVLIEATLATLVYRTLDARRPLPANVPAS